MSTAPQSRNPAQIRRRRAVPVLPLMLLAAGRRAVVVGAGPIAARKARSLLDAGARVVVVAPEAAARIRTLARRGRLAWRPRRFRASDVAGAFLVLAATNTPAVNRAVLAACRRRGVLCGIVDRGWEQADFLSPAVLRRRGLTVAVSTGGRDPHEAREVRDRIARRLDSGEVDTQRSLEGSTSRSRMPPV